MGFQGCNLKDEMNQRNGMECNERGLKGLERKGDVRVSYDIISDLMGKNKIFRQKLNPPLKQIFVFEKICR